MDAHQLKILQAVEDALDGERLTPEEIALVKAEGIDILELTGQNSSRSQTDYIIGRGIANARRNNSKVSFWKRFF